MVLKIHVIYYALLLFLFDRINIIKVYYKYTTRIKRLISFLIVGCVNREFFYKSQKYDLNIEKYK